MTTFLNCSSLVLNNNGGGNSKPITISPGLGNVIQVVNGVTQPSFYAFGNVEKNMPILSIQDNPIMSYDPLTLSGGITFDSSTGEFTLPVAGAYTLTSSVFAKVESTAGSVTGYIQLAIGVPYYGYLSGSSVPFTTTDYNVTLNGTHTGLFNAGDKVIFTLRQQNSADADTTVTTLASAGGYMSIFRIN